MKKYNFITLVTVTLFTTAIVGQEETTKKKLGAIVTDRPDQTESSALVPKRYLQIETGAFYETLVINNINSKTTTFNTTLLRYGLLDNLELRVGFSNSEVKRQFNSNNLKDVTSGFSPLSLGVKIGVAEEKGLLPKIAFLSHINFPFFASQDFKPKSTGIDFRFSFAHTLNKKSSFGYNVGMLWDGDITTANYLYTITYGFSIADNVGTFLEIYGNLPEDSHFNHFWDAGFTYLINDNIQLDISGGTGITKNVQDLFLSAGISLRLPK